MCPFPPATRQGSLAGASPSCSNAWAKAHFESKTPRCPRSADTVEPPDEPIAFESFLMMKALYTTREQERLFAARRPTRTAAPGGQHKAASARGGPFLYKYFPVLTWYRGLPRDVVRG